MDIDYGARKPFQAKLIGATLLSSPNAVERRVIEARISLSCNSVTYRSGDSISVAPENPPDIVYSLLRRLGLAD